MSPLKVACPGCQATLSALPPFSPGLQVKCSSCGTQFALSAATAIRAAVPVAVGVSPPTPRPIAPESRRFPWGLVAGVLAVLVLAGCGAIVIALARARKQTSDIAVSPNPAPVEEKAEKWPAPLTLSTPEEADAPVRQRWLNPSAARGAMASGLPTAQQESVNRAIERGVAYLKQEQRDDGSWGQWGHPVGYAALPGLTLLECGVPPDDPVVQKAAAFVREHAADLGATYELALAVLFLERLGEIADRPLVRELTLRLIAGQLADGGWTYRCPVLDATGQKTLAGRLEHLRADDPDGVFKTVGEAQSDKPPKTAKRQAKGKRVDLTAILRHVPALQEPLEIRQEPNTPNADNSNTQFAVLALWAAQRQGVPVARALALVAQRFRPSQNEDGGWGYHSQGGRRKPSTGPMTCVGLLGLAVGHGLGRDETVERGKVEDPQIDTALQYLAGQIGTAEGGKRRRSNQNLYFLWSLERVGVLYGLKTISGKDWYAWGVELLLANQADEGNWQNGGYHSSTPPLDTCFALLFLKRANLAHDLTKKIEFLKIAPRRPE